MLLVSVLVLFLWCNFPNAQGHGMMVDPVSRSSVWRLLPDSPVNYNDNEVFCGGIQTMIKNGGCGPCGDDLALPQPRPNENTGVFGTGRIVEEYQSGQVVEVSVKLTANHVGYFQYSLCDNGNGTEPESGEDCFQPLTLEDGSDRRNIDSSEYDIKSLVKLPEGLTCEHCVLRWHYKAGNSWGLCDDGSEGMGCGDQETFRNCADIRIV